MRRWIIALLCTIAAPAALATEALEAEARDRLTAELKDPFSAQFRELREQHTAGMRVICGEVNARNSYGAYVGFRPFVLTPDNAILVNTVDPAVGAAYVDIITHLCKAQP